MSKKFKIKRLQINFTNRWLYTLIVFFSLIAIGVGVYAIAPGGSGDPGHNIQSIGAPSVCTTDQFLQWDGSAWTCADADVDAGGIDGSGTANYIPKFTATTTVGNSVIYETAGDVGIGTTSPVYELDVNGGVNADFFIGDGSGLTNLIVRVQGMDETCDSTIDGLLRYRSNYCIAETTVVSDFSICMRKSDSYYGWYAIKSYSWAKACTCPSGTTYFECTGDYAAPGCYASRPYGCFRYIRDPPGTR